MSGIGGFGVGGYGPNYALRLTSNKKEEKPEAELPKLEGPAPEDNNPQDLNGDGRVDAFERDVYRRMVEMQKGFFI